MHTIRSRITTVVDLLLLAENAVTEMQDNLPSGTTADELDAMHFQMQLHRAALDRLNLQGQADRRRIAGLRSHRDSLERAMQACSLSAGLLEGVLAEELTADLRRAVNGIKFGIEVLANELEARLPPWSELPTHYTIANA